jgi:hypothetical protein
MIRITADLDGIPMSIARARTLAVINYLHHYKNIIIDSKIIRLSSSKKGVHVILWTSQNIGINEIFYIRLLLGDDTKRLARDLKRRRPRQYLFKKKIRLR